MPIEINPDDFINPSHDQLKDLKNIHGSILKIRSNNPAIDQLLREVGDAEEQNHDRTHDKDPEFDRVRVS